MSDANEGGRVERTESEGYVEVFTRAYERLWAPFPRRMSETWLRFHQAVAPEADRRMLDVGCGTGIVARRFADAGYRVTALDSSAAMLAVARDRLADMSDSVSLLHADAADFTVDGGHPLALSTYDVPNHLPDLAHLRSYLGCVFSALAPGGWFGFDLSTAKGLRTLHNITVRDEPEYLVVVRGTMDEAADRGFLRISGVVRADDGRYDRFTTTIRNTRFAVSDVLRALREAGWTGCYVAGPEDPRTPLDDPEEHPRVVVVARKP